MLINLSLINFGTPNEFIEKDNFAFQFLDFLEGQKLYFNVPMNNEIYLDLKCFIDEF
jgi:hypothetical protein